MSDNDDLCIDGYHCDDSECDSDIPNGQPCDELSDCQSDYCEGNVCCDSDECCADQTNCSAQKPICSDAFQCVLCTQQDQCADQYPTTAPICNTDGRCVQCLNNDHCRQGDYPFNSTLGLCTPDKTCTCYAETAKAACTQPSDCPPGYDCAQDFTAQDQLHYACLQPCDPTDTDSPTNGLFCDNRQLVGSSSSAAVWVPMTTCYAFETFGANCDTDQDICCLELTF